jgi:hypothetical protein
LPRPAYTLISNKLNILTRTEGWIDGFLVFLAGDRCRLLAIKRRDPMVLEWSMLSCVVRFVRFVKLMLCRHQTESRANISLLCRDTIF